MGKFFPKLHSNNILLWCLDLPMCLHAPANWPAALQNLRKPDFRTSKLYTEISNGMFDITDWTLFPQWNMGMAASFSGFTYVSVQVDEVMNS